MIPQTNGVETSYRGTLFRSRLEVRWAFFLDCLGLSWNYEPEAYRLESGAVAIPDFWVDALNAFIEVKASVQAAEAQSFRFSELAKVTSQKLYVVWGHPGIPDRAGFSIDCCRVFADRWPAPEPWLIYFAEGGGDLGYLPTVCPDCGKVSVQFEARAARSPCSCWNEHDQGDRRHQPHSRWLHRAYEPQLRFEGTRKVMVEGELPADWYAEGLAEWAKGYNWAWEEEDFKLPDGQPLPTKRR